MIGCVMGGADEKPGPVVGGVPASSEASTYGLPSKLSVSRVLFISLLESGGGGGGGGDAAEAEEEKEAEEEVEEAPPAVDVSVTGVPLSSCSFLSVVSALPHFQLIVSDVWRR